MSALDAAEAALAALHPRPYPLPLGRLAPVVEGAFQGFGRTGWVVCGPRERVGATLRGCPVERLVDAASGARPYKLAPCSEAPGNRALHAVGLALANREPVLCLLGTASAASGAFYEACNVAGITGAPVIFVVTVLPLDDGAPVGPQLAGAPAALASACGLAAHTVAPGEIAAAVSSARASARPTLIQVHLE